MNDDVHETIAGRLRRTGQRYTRGRQVLVDLLVSTDRPLTIGELQAAGAPQSQSSLYRNLGVLESCDVVRRLTSVDDVARYELDEDLVGHHHHLVCAVCGRVEDVELPAAVEASLIAAGETARPQQGFRIESHRVEFVGTCRGCG